MEGKIPKSGGINFKKEYSMADFQATFISQRLALMKKRPPYENSFRSNHNDSM